MLVKTPAMKLGVELREINMESNKIVWNGVANAMPCTVEMGPTELRQMASMLLKPNRLFKVLKLMMSKEEET